MREAYLGMGGSLTEELLKAVTAVSELILLPGDKVIWQRQSNRLENSGNRHFAWMQTIIISAFLKFIASFNDHHASLYLLLSSLQEETL